MSWPTWSAAAAPIPTAVQSTLMSSAINSAPAVMAPMGYNQDQWAQAQQQNWQQWAQWQQQYQQWHQQYGAEYQKSMSAMQGALPPPMQVQPPLPAAMHAAVAPPLPIENKPPLPPEEPPAMPQSAAAMSAYSSMPTGYSTASALMAQTVQMQHQLPVAPSALQTIYHVQPTNQSWPSAPQKRPYTQETDYNDPAKRAMLQKPAPSQWPAAAPNYPQAQPAAAAVAATVAAPVAATVAAPVAAPPAQAPKGNVEELSEAEKKFDKEFAAWEAQFNKWKEQNANHPDKTQYKEYEKKWESWRNSLLERREQMRRKRIALTGQTATPPTGAVTQKPLAQPEAPIVPALPQPPAIKPALLGAYPGDPSLRTNDIFHKPPPNQNNEPLSFKSKTPFSAPDNAPNSGEGFLTSASASGGIPGLDLVKDDAKEDLPDRSDVVEKAGENIQEKPQGGKGPDFEAISKGINNILGDQKLLSMLSMVSQNAPPGAVASNVTTDTISNMPQNYGQNFGIPPPNFQQYAPNNFNAPPPLFNDLSNQNFNKPNKVDYYQQRNAPNPDMNIAHSRFGGPPPNIRSNFGSGAQNTMDNFNAPPFGGTGGPRENLPRGPAVDNFSRGSGDNLSRDSGDNFSRGPGDNLSRGPVDNFPRGPGDNLSRGPVDNFPRGPGDNLSRGPVDNFARGPGDNLSRGPVDNFARGPGDNLSRGSVDNFARGPGDNLSRGSVDNFARGPGDNLSRGSGDNFSRGAIDNLSGGAGDNFSRGPGDNLSRGPGDNNFSRGPGNFDRGGDKFNRNDQFSDNFKGNRNDNDFRNDRFDDNYEGNKFNRQGNNFNNRDHFGNHNRSDSFNKSNDFDEDYDNFNDEEDYDKYNDMFRDDEDDHYQDNGYHHQQQQQQQRSQIRPLMSEPQQKPKIPSLLDLPPAPPHIQPVQPVVEEPPIEEEEIFEPVTVIDYEHQSKELLGEDVITVVPVNMFDYNHKPVNRIALPERPMWLAESIKFIREFDPQALRFERPSGPPETRFPTSGRDDDQYGRFEGRDRHRMGNRRDRSFERDDFHRIDRDREPRDRELRDREPREREPRDREPRDRELSDREPRDRETREREPRDREPREREPRDRETRDRYNRSSEQDDFRNDNFGHNQNFSEDRFGKDSRDDYGRTNRKSAKGFEESSDNEMDFETTEKVRRNEEMETRKSRSKSPELSNPPNPSAKQIEITMIEDIINAPGRYDRPPRIVIILRGPPGSGKTFLAKQIKDKEVENGGSAPRILSLDDYFMVEQEKKVVEDGKTQLVKEMVYEYEVEMEESYRQSFMKSFKKTITDGYFPFIIVDNVNDKVKYFGEMWSFAKQNGFQVYICQMDLDPVQCTKRNVHNRSETEIEDIISGWEPTPSHHPTIDASGLLQMCAIADVEMELEEQQKETVIEEKVNPEDQVRSKWDNFDCSSNNLAKLDGVYKPLRKSRTMEEYLQLESEWEPPKPAQPGKKRVRWADLEEQRSVEKMRAIGFVVGQTDWDRMMDPTGGSRALTQTKYIEKVSRYKH